MSEPEIARIEVSLPRRLVGAAVTLAIAVIFGSAFLVEGHWAMLVLSAGAFAMSAILWKATAGAIVLTMNGLSDGNGQVIAALDQIDTLVTGHFTFRPSNGFSLKMKTQGAARWRPGLWWSFGRRVGVGGLAAGRRTKAFAEALDELLRAQSVR